MMYCDQTRKQVRVEQYEYDSERKMLAFRVPATIYIPNEFKFYPVSEDLYSLSLVRGVFDFYELQTNHVIYSQGRRSGKTYATSR